MYINHSILVSYVVAALTQQCIEKNLDIDYNFVISQIDNMLCQYANDNGNILFDSLTVEQLTDQLKNITKLPIGIDLKEMAFNTFSFIWMESQSF